MKIKILISIMFLTISIFGKDAWSRFDDANNSKLFQSLSNLKVIKTKARNYSQTESDLIAKFMNAENKEITTRKHKSPNLYDITTIRNDYELLRKTDEMGFFRWETEWEDTLFQVSKSVEDNSFEKHTLENIDTAFRVKVKKAEQTYLERRCGYYDGGIKQQSMDLVPICFYLYKDSNDNKYGIVVPIFKNHSHIYYN